MTDSAGSPIQYIESVDQLSDGLRDLVTAINRRRATTVLRRVVRHIIPSEVSLVQAVERSSGDEPFTSGDDLVDDA
jgi:hypothetical protein